MSEPIRIWIFDKAPLSLQFMKPNSMAVCSFISAVPLSFDLPPIWLETPPFCYSDTMRVNSKNYTYYFS